jgi:hypothetical protein
MPRKLILAGKKTEVASSSPNPSFPYLLLPQEKTSLIGLPLVAQSQTAVVPKSDFTDFFTKFGNFSGPPAFDWEGQSVFDDAN